MDDKDREIQKTREYNYVLWAIIVVLGLMVVNLFAQQTCTNDEFVKEVSFASTISSIILSVIAIIMTVVSNDSIGLLLHRFRDLHDDIKEVPTNLKKSLDSIENSVSQLNKVETELSELPTLLQSLINTTNNNIVNLSSMISDISYKTNMVHQTLKNGLYGSKIENNPSKEFTLKELYETLIRKSSYWGNCLIYAIFYANELSVTSLSLSEFSTQIAWNNNDINKYFWGFIVGINATGLISAKCEGDRIEIYGVDKSFDKQFIYNFHCCPEKIL